MGYVKTSTANPLGHKPWNFATSNNGLSRYDQANFVIPAPSSGNPLTNPQWRPGMGRYTAQPFVIPTHGMAGLLSRGHLGEYTAQNFVIPTSTVLVGTAPPPPWGRTGMGDYEVDPATLPPAPAGMQYNSAYQLVPIPKQSNTPLIIAGLLAAGAAFWYFEGGGKKFFSAPKMKLPVVQTLPGVRA